MKTTLAMDKKSDSTIIQTPVLSYPEHNSSKGKWMHAGFSIILAMLAVILVFQALSYRHVLHLSEETSRNALPDKVETIVNYHIEETGNTIREEIIVDNREVDITTPDARFIFDYYRGIFVTKPIGDQIEDCFVAHFNKTMDIDDIKEAYLNAKDEESAHLNPEGTIYQTTNETVPMQLLSPRAQEMCRNEHVFMVRETGTWEIGEASRKRRKGCIHIEGCILGVSFEIHIEWGQSEEKEQTQEKEQPAEN